MAVLQDININVHGQPSEKRLQTFLRLSQNENGRMINFRVLGPPLPSNCTATFSGTKPDGNVYSKAGTVTGNFVVIEEDIQMTAVAGVWDAKLDIINGTHNIMTALIRVVVDADVVDPDAIASDSQLQGLVAEAKYYAEHARTDAYGSPLTAPTKAQMTDHTRVYVYTGSEPNMVAGNWYYWNGSAWASGGVYNAVAVQTDTTLSVAGKPADGKVTGDAIEELKEDLNLTTTETSITPILAVGGFSGAVGEEIVFNAETPWQRTHIDVAEKTKYRITFYNREGLSTDVNYIVEVDQNGVVLKRSGFIDHAQSTQNNEVILLPEANTTTVWIRGRNGNQYPFTLTAIAPDTVAMQEDINQINNEIDEIKSDLTVQEKIVNNWENGSFAAATGNNVASTAILRNIDFVSLDGIDKIKTLGGYTFNVFGNDGTNYLGFYNGTTFTTRGSALGYYVTERSAEDLRNAGAVKVKLTIRRSDGTDISPNESDHLVLERSALSEHDIAINSIETRINTVQSKYNHGRFDIRRPWFTHLYTGLQSDYSAFGESTKYADILTAFDALMAEAPDYISKNALGTASGTDAGGNSYTIYEYIFKPKQKSTPYYSVKMPKLYMDGSIHGFEKNSTYGLYYFLKDLVENFAENESLMYMRSQVEIHVIPVSNPYGFDNNGYVNGNGVNINRNFNHKGEWTAVTTPETEVNGLAPFDQPESAIIRDWLLADENNILMYFNCHTNGRIASGYPEMNPCMTSNDRNDAYFNKLIGVFANHIEIQTAMLPLMYNTIQPSSTEMCGTITTSATETATKGTASTWANTMQSMLSMTLEVFNGLRDANSVTVIDKFSDASKKICAEIMGNLFLQVLSEYSPY